MKPSRRHVALAALLLIFSTVVPGACVQALALDCTKAPDSATKACKVLQQSTAKTSQSEEVNAASALAQKNAAIAARKAAEAKASKSPGTVSTPVATTIPVPKVSALSTSSPSASTSASPSALPSNPTVDSASPSATVSPAATQNKVKIICIKGSKKKIVLGISPKCPNGYRKK